MIDLQQQIVESNPVPHSYMFQVFTAIFGPLWRDPPSPFVLDLSLLQKVMGTEGEGKSSNEDTCPGDTKMGIPSLLERFPLALERAPLTSCWCLLDRK